MMAMERRKLIILRGVPGSGKSTYARQLLSESKDSGVICSTDDFFIDPITRRYTFNPELLREYHSRNRDKATQAMKDGKSPIIIDNTNLGKWEMEPYVKMAIQHGYDIEIKEPPTTWKYNISELALKNSKGLDELKIERMLARFERNVTVADLT